MLSFWMLIPIAIIVISFIAGFIFFYFISPFATIDIKKRLEEISSLLINFVIYIWIGKVILNISLFIQDPLAVLAYPSNSHAFYIAILFIVLNITYNIKRHNFNYTTFLHAFIPVFLVASFVYEFIQIAWNGNTYTWNYLGLLLALILVFILLQEKLTSKKNLLLLPICWSLGQLIFSIIMPYTTVFGYMMASWILSLILIAFIGLFIFNRRAN